MIVEFIAQNENWRELMIAKAIKVKEDGDLAIFNYSLLDGCNFKDPLVKEARGIIVNTKTFENVCVGFDKFFNYTEPFADDIDWNSARVQDKIDGSIMKLYFYNGQWVWATNGCIKASEAENSFGYVFEALIESAVNYNDLDFSKLNPEFTYIFELVSPFNQIVIKYDETKLYHTGTRCNKTMQEVVVDIGVEKPNEYSIGSLEDCVKAVEALNPVKDDVRYEGYVVVDGQWRRIKVKSPEYFLLHHAVAGGNVTKRNVLQFLLEDDFNKEKFCKEFPQYIPIIEFYEKELNRVFKEADEMINYTRALFEQYKGNRKRVAKVLADQPLKAIGFWGLNHEGGGREYWSDFNKLYKVVKKYGE